MIAVQLYFVLPMLPHSVKHLYSSLIGSSLLPFLLQRVNAKNLCHVPHHIPVDENLAGHNPVSSPLEQDLFVDFMGIAYASSDVGRVCGQKSKQNPLIFAPG